MGLETVGLNVRLDDKSQTALHIIPIAQLERTSLAHFLN